MKSADDKKIFIENLKKVPIIQAACERSSVSRASVYRWKKQSKKFAQDMEEALQQGEELINDLSEGQLIKMIKEGNFSAVRLWLGTRHPKFRQKIEVTARMEKQEELTPEQEAMIRQALNMASLDSGQKPLTNEPQKDEKEK